jgi:hypothetical protein
MSRRKLHARRRDWPDTYLWTPKRQRRLAERTAKHYASKGVSARDLMVLTKNKIPYAPWFERYLDHRLDAERAREA